MFGALFGAIAVWIAGLGLVAKIILSVTAAVLAVAIVAKWDEWGEKVFMSVLAVMAIAMTMYLGAAIYAAGGSFSAAATAMGVSEVTLFAEVAITLGALVITAPTLFEWAGDLISFFIQTMGRVLKEIAVVIDEVTDAVPFLRYMKYGLYALLGFKAVDMVFGED